MSYVLTCPNCGPREVTDFSFGGEVNPRPTERPGKRELGAYNYFRRNVAGVQREWWFHRSGCGAWFLAERDTRTNQVLFTEVPRSGTGHERPEAVSSEAGGRGSSQNAGRMPADETDQDAGPDAPRR
jgi:heterotetrameric sarcosine oxidase delta subunit